MLKTIITDILQNTKVTACSERYKLIMDAFDFFKEQFGASSEKMKVMVVQVMRAQNHHMELLYWYMRKESIETALSLIQRDAVELTDYVLSIVENPFACDVFGLKEGTQQKMLSVFHCIERLFNLMEVIEDELELNEEEYGKISLSVDMMSFKKRFLACVPIYKGENLNEDHTILKNFDKMKLQIAFIVYLGLIMLSYSFNKYCRTIKLLAQLSFLLTGKAISWRGYVKPELTKYIRKFKEAIFVGKLSNAPEIKKIMKSPSEINKKKGKNFFKLWSKHIIIRKLYFMIKLKQDNYKEKPETLMFRMKNKINKSNSIAKNEGLEQFYEKESFSLFQ